MPFSAQGIPPEGCTEEVHFYSLLRAATPSVECSGGGSVTISSASCENTVVPVLAKGAADQSREPYQLLPQAGVGQTHTIPLAGA